MNHFRRFLCFCLALVMLVMVLPSCGGAEDPQPDPTDPAPTEPPVTTGPPCENHLFAQGSSCAEDRICTVCGRTVPAFGHTFYDSICTVDRTCTVCGTDCPAEADHVYGDPFACGTKRCVNCTYVEYGSACTRVGGICTLCGTDAPAPIPYVYIDGVALHEFAIVTPEAAKNDYNDYVAIALRHRLNSWCRLEKDSVTDNAEKSGPEIRIGMTNRTVSTVEEGQFLVRVINGDMEILCNGMYAYEALLNWVSDTFSMYRTDGILFEEGTVVDETYASSVDDPVLGDVRVMYHNMLGFVDGYNTPLRYSFYRWIYDHYQPDVICMQETYPQHSCGVFFSSKNCRNLKEYLEGIGYGALSADTAMALFYNSNTLELIAEDFVFTRGAYGTSWALFCHKATGKYFGVTNSHFSANSTTNNDATLGNEARINDAKSVVTAKDAIIAAAKAANIADAERIPVISGGDYNCRVGDDPIEKVLVPAGFVNARDAVSDKTRVDDYATHGEGPTWNATYKYHRYAINSPIPGTGNQAIDHCYLIGSGESVTANQYRIITNLLAGGCSDHRPHYVDVTLGG